LQYFNDVFHAGQFNLPTRPPARAGMMRDMLGSIGRIAGLLCFAAAAFFTFIFAASVYRRFTHGRGHSVTEDLIVLAVMVLLVLILTVAGSFLSRKPPT
jgi:predicted PurR-regulated permease PerM